MFFKKFGEIKKRDKKIAKYKPFKKYKKMFDPKKILLKKHTLLFKDFLDVINI